MNAFDTQHLRALRTLVLAKLSHQPARLASFSEEPRSSINRKFVGVQEISVDKIVGTLGREADFDHKFRPLSLHLRERWVDVFVSFSPENSLPVLVHKIGERYYVEDGHHRISVARALGMAYIKAEVWEYLPRPMVAKSNQLTQCCPPSCLGEACPA